eukprot:1872498-Pleurochrysis_carterae.AAC.2
MRDCAISAPLNSRACLAPFCAQSRGAVEKLGVAPGTVVSGCSWGEASSATELSELLTTAVTQPGAPLFMLDELLGAPPETSRCIKKRDEGDAFVLRAFAVGVALHANAIANAAASVANSAGALVSADNAASLKITEADCCRNSRACMLLARTLSRCHLAMA